MDANKALIYFRLFYVNLKSYYNYVETNQKIVKYRNALSSVEHELERKLVLNHAREGMNERIAYESMDRERKVLSFPKGYSYILRLHKDDYQELIERWQKAIDINLFMTPYLFDELMYLVRDCGSIINFLKKANVIYTLDYDRWIKVLDFETKFKYYKENNIKEYTIPNHKSQKEWDICHKIGEKILFFKEEYVIPLIQKFVYTLCDKAIDKKLVNEFIWGFDQFIIYLYPNITEEGVKRIWNGFKLKTRNFKTLPLCRTEIPGLREYIVEMTGKKPEPTIKVTSTKSATPIKAKSVEKKSTKPSKIAAEPQQKVVFVPKVEENTQPKIQPKPTKKVTKPVKKVEDPKPAITVSEPKEKPIKKAKSASSGFYTLEPDFITGLGFAARDVKTVYNTITINKEYKMISFREKSKLGDEINGVKKLIIEKNVDPILIPGTFKMFTGLEELVFLKPSMVSELPAYMLGDCKVKHIEIPDSLKKIDKYCFALCKTLESISVNKKLNISDLILPSGCKIIKR